MKKVIIYSIILILILSSCSIVQNSPDSFKGRFEDALKQKAEYKCTGADDKGNLLIELFIKDTKFKAKAKTNQGTILSVGDSKDCMYGWLENTAVGEQVCITREEIKQGVNIFEKSKDTNIMVNCNKADVPGTIFEVPKGINFFPPA